MQNRGRYQSKNQISQRTCNLTPLVRNICLECCGKGEQFLLLPTIFCYLMLDVYVKTRIRFSFRDKRLFAITEVEITRVDCISGHLLRDRERREGEMIDESENVQTTPTRTYCKCRRPLSYCNTNCRTPLHWKFYPAPSHHLTTPIFHTLWPLIRTLSMGRF